VLRAPLGQARGEEVSEIVRQNQKRIAKALAAERGEEPLSEDPDIDKDDKKSLYEASLTAHFEVAKSMLDETLTACKGLLENGVDSNEVRALVLEMVQTAKVHHRYMKLDDNYKVVRPNNGQAADKIMECLAASETIDQALMCVYSQVYWLTYTDEEIAAIKAGANPVQTDSEETTKSGDEPKEDYLTQLAAYLSHLAGEFASKVEEVEIGDVHVLVPRAETVRLRQARSNGVWLLSYDSILGEDNNPWKGSEGSRYQGQFDRRVADQELAAGTNPGDTEALRQLIRESVPRSEDSDTPRNYILMTRTDNEALMEDIARLLDLSVDSTLLGWLRSELIKGADANQLRALLAEKQREWAERDAAKEKNLLARRPVQTPSAPALVADESGSEARERLLRSVKAFMRSEIDGLSPEEARARKAEIIKKAKALL